MHGRDEEWTSRLLCAGCHGCHVLVDEEDTLRHQSYLRLGFVDMSTIDQHDRMILLGKQF